MHDIRDLRRHEHATHSGCSKFYLLTYLLTTRQTMEAKDDKIEASYADDVTTLHEQAMS